MLLVAAGCCKSAYAVRILIFSAAGFRFCLASNTWDDIELWKITSWDSRDDDSARIPPYIKMDNGDMYGAGILADGVKYDVAAVAQCGADKSSSKHLQIQVAAYCLSNSVPRIHGIP
jgi:hypothetical protein